MKLNTFLPASAGFLLGFLPKRRAVRELRNVATQ
jgi:hypothetical protein